MIQNAENLTESEAKEKYSCHTIGCPYKQIYKNYECTCICNDCPNRSSEWAEVLEIDMTYIAYRESEKEKIQGYMESANSCENVGEILKNIGMERAGVIVCTGAATIKGLVYDFVNQQDILRENGFSSVWDLLSSYQKLNPVNTGKSYGHSFKKEGE